MPSPFRTRRRVEFADTDMAGIVHFTAFFRYMEAAEHALLRSVGLRVHHGPHELPEAGAASPEGHSLSFPRVSARCDFHSPARCDDELEVEVAVLRLGKTSVSYSFRLLRDEEELAVGEMTSVCCRMRPGAPPEPTPLPEDVIARLQPHLAPA
ncbi:MAG: acyl-CoA thioesterase [Lacipirellulaceae bacterium]